MKAESRSLKKIKLPICHYLRLFFYFGGFKTDSKAKPGNPNRTLLLPQISQGMAGVDITPHELEKRTHEVHPWTNNPSKPFVAGNMGSSAVAGPDFSACRSGEGVFFNDRRPEAGANKGTNKGFPTQCHVSGPVSVGESS